MAAIKDLLNPVPEKPVSFSRSPTLSNSKPHPATIIMQSKDTPQERRPKNLKDAAVFRHNTPTGPIRFRPCEERTAELTAIHERFKLFPMGESGRISDFPRNIPYQSDKKNFQVKTGRDSFNVYQYTFQIPGSKDGRTWVMMWDYNIGLVRTTHLFKCMDYAKTAPSKVMSQNKGLREISHSITGGALAAQGYWMPFETAKHVAAQFCWPIRHVLTPMFGNDFPDLCRESKERSRQIVINPSIIHMETDRAKYFRQLEIGLRKSETPPSPGSPVPSSSTSYTPRSPPDSEAFQPLNTPQRPFKFQRKSYTDSIASARESSSEPYYSEAPISPTPGTFTPVNVPRSTYYRPRMSHERPCSPESMARYSEPYYRTRDARMAQRTRNERHIGTLESRSSRKRPAKHLIHGIDGVVDGANSYVTHSSDLTIANMGAADEDQSSSPRDFRREIKAARALIEMRKHLREACDAERSNSPFVYLASTSAAWVRSPDITREYFSKRRASL